MRLQFWERLLSDSNGPITVCENCSDNSGKKTLTGLSKKDFIISTGVEFGLYERYDVLEIPICSSENSCKGRCTNQTHWGIEIKLRCSCDPDCYEVFKDCCADYTKYCGAQIPKETLTKKYNYTCTKIGHYRRHKDFLYPEGDGLWMVTRCPPEWANDNLRTKCEEPVNPLDDLSRYLPVVGHDNTTFRNEHCSICNGVERYESWPSRLYFPSPATDQARRHCVNEIIDSCHQLKRFESCSDGDVALVSYENRYVYKNAHCANCDGKSKKFSCFPREIPLKMRRGLKIVKAPSAKDFLVPPFVKSKPFQSSDWIADKKCGKSGMIFDDSLRACRVNWLELEQQRRFTVYAWLEPPRSSQNNSFTTHELQYFLVKYLNISHLQLFHINITVLPCETETYLVSSTIALTPQQSLELKSRNQTESFGKKLRNYIYFSEPFALQIKGLYYTVTKTTSRPLVGVENTTYARKEYILKENGRVFIPSTNKSYDRYEYTLDKEGSITIFKKYVSTKCNGSVVLYTTEEYTRMVNLSIYVNKTLSLYHYGEYDILPDTSVAICQYFKETRQTTRHDEPVGLGYITLISFILSILFLIFLLVTYIFFPQLRTLPGKNLMNFTASLLFFHVFWLPLNFGEVRSDKPSCKAVAVMDHYFLMTSFVSMSIIVFHTCKVFARSLPARKMSVGHQRKMFCRYLAFVWILPGVFVAICVVLDEQDVVKIGYGESEICWLTEHNAYTYFVTIPIAVLLLFNIIAFVITAVYVRKHGQNTAAGQASGNRRSNLSIYVKLSTLMGFSWLFGLLALVVTSTTVFWYFFVIFTSLQGVFVAVAFVVNAKTFNLYKQKYKSGQTTLRPKATTRNGFRKNTDNNETKL